MPLSKKDYNNYIQKHTQRYLYTKLIYDIYSEKETRFSWYLIIKKYYG